MKNYFTSILLLTIISLLSACEKDLSPDCPNTSHMHAIDLGLSVRWACCNVGASVPEDFGSYFAWGETTTKEIYNWDTYKYAQDSHDKLTKYCTDNRFGETDHQTTLVASDDAARVQLGNNWRMPTLNEMKELVERCTWKETTLNGVKGYIVKGPNKNQIFIPFAEYIYGKDVVHKDLSCYWTNEVGTPCHTAQFLYRGKGAYYPENTDQEESAFLFFKGKETKEISTINRSIGLPIRAVTK